MTTGAVFLALLSVAQGSGAPSTSSGVPLVGDGTLGFSRWPAGGRFVDTGFDTSDLADQIYANGLPPELLPQFFYFQKVASGGWQAELDFPAPVIQLHHYLAGDSNDAGDAFPDEAVPVRHTVDLVLQPPSGDATTVSVQADGTTVVTKAGAQLATAQSVFVGNRLLITVPADAGVGTDWTVQAVIRVTGDSSLGTKGGRALPSAFVFSTQPAMVGVLTGDTATAPEPLSTKALINATTRGVQPPDAVDLPEGGRPIAVHLEQGSNGLVAVVTTDSPPKPLAANTTVGGQAIQGEQLDLSLAPDVVDGLGVARLEVEYSYPNSLCGQPQCPVAATAQVLNNGASIGDVPVTISGNDVRFDFGGFIASKPSNAPPPSVTLDDQLFGALTETATFDSNDLDMVPLDANSAPMPAGATTTVAIDGTQISITSPAGETATGTINPFTGYFFATDADEMWSGFLGKDGWYTRVLTATPAAAVRDSQRADLSPGDQILDLVHYYWVQKTAKAWHALPQSLIPYLKEYRPPGGFENPSVQVSGISRFVDAVSDWFSHQQPDYFFPLGYDPVTVPPSAPIPFALATSLPKLSPDGGQWELAVGVKLFGEHGVPVFALGPYVPASSLLTAATSGGNATGSAQTASSSSKGGSSGSGLVIALVAVLVAGGAGALVWTRRRNRA